MKRAVWSKFIPVEPRPANISLNKTISAMEHRRVLQSYFPSLPKLLSGEARFGVEAVFYINGNKTKRHPKSDLDNLIKGLIDSLTGFFWVDDSQIDEIQARVIREANKTGIHLKVYLLREEVERVKNEKAAEKATA